MDTKVVDALVQVYDTFVPPKEELDKMPQEAQTAIHGMAHFTAGLMVGTQMNAEGVSKLADSLKGTKETVTQPQKPAAPVNPRAQTG